MHGASVSLVRCPDYDRGRLRAAVDEALMLIPTLPTLLQRGRRVLLKPNLLSSCDPPERAVNTHPEFVRAVAEFFLARGCQVTVGDSCGSLAPGSTGRAIATTGLNRVASELGLRLCDFDRASASVVEIPGARILKQVRLPQILHETDLFVTLPKFKTHGLTLLTGAVKNQLGLIAGKGKKDVHLLAPKPALMAEALLDIHSAVQPQLAVMDAIVGMEGNGPAAGRPRQVGLVIASDDCLALDAVAAEIMGYGRDEVDTVRLGRERGLGVGTLENIRLLGLPLAEAILENFAKPPRVVRSGLMRALPGFLIRWAFDSVGTTYATILDDRCVACGECIANCPARAMRRVGGRIRADRSRCISCYCCSEVCERRAIELRRPLIGRILYAIARMGQPSVR